jgi:hypothetical protein
MDIDAIKKIQASVHGNMDVSDEDLKSFLVEELECAKNYFTKVSKPEFHPMILCVGFDILTGRRTLDRCEVAATAEQIADTEAWDNTMFDSGKDIVRTLMHLPCMFFLSKICVDDDKECLLIVGRTAYRRCVTTLIPAYRVDNNIRIKFDEAVTTDPNDIVDADFAEAALFFEGSRVGSRAMMGTVLKSIVETSGVEKATELVSAVEQLKDKLAQPTAAEDDPWGSYHGQD